VRVTPQYFGRGRGALKPGMRAGRIWDSGGADCPETGHPGIPNLRKTGRPPIGVRVKSAETNLVETNRWIDFRDSGIHGMGGFARTRIGQGTEMIEYVGERISKEESLRRCEENNPFIFGLTETEDLDGNVPWNPARFLNHSCHPNCEALEDEGHIWIVAARDIEPGEELTFNYGYSLDDYREHPCRCGAEQCVGFMVAEEFHPLVRGKCALG